VFSPMVPVAPRIATPIGPLMTATAR
jgi:hypothetical protein